MREKLLRVTAPHFVAGAVFTKNDDCSGWKIRQVAPIIGWMRGKSLSDIRAYLERKGWSWEWLA